MDPEETVTISLAEYQGLLESQRFLTALEEAGVDNWDGYSYAFERLGDGEFDMANLIGDE